MNSTSSGSAIAAYLEATGELREVPGHPGYFVTRNGSVLSTRRSMLHPLSQREDAKGYFTVCLDGRTRKVHQLVLEAWGVVREDGQETRHLDGVPSHNVLGNLAFGTSAENKADQVRLGTHNMARKAVCPAEHQFAEHGYRDRGGKRRCTKCEAERTAARRG